MSKTELSFNWKSKLEPSVAIFTRGDMMHSYNVWDPSLVTKMQGLSTEEMYTTILPFMTVLTFLGWLIYPNNFRTLQAGLIYLIQLSFYQCLLFIQISTHLNTIKRWRLEWVPPPPSFCYFGNDLVLIKWFLLSFLYIWCFKL